AGARSGPIGAASPTLRPAAAMARCTAASPRCRAGKSTRSRGWRVHTSHTGSRCRSRPPSTRPRAASWSPPPRGTAGFSARARWALPKGCAVAYTAKGAGTDYFDLDAGLGVRADGTVGAPADGLAFVPDPASGRGVAVKHAHSRDNPEADWGVHVKQAAEFALQALDRAFPQAAPFAFDNTTVIAVGISNGGGAVLRAAEADGDDWLDAVVAGAPNITVAGARPL